MIDVVQWSFMIFASLLLVSALGVIFSRNTVRSVLFLIAAFFASAVLWLLLQAEFLALVLLFVYVGAVMTLFLFVVMMLNLQEGLADEKMVRYLPLGIAVMLGLLGLLVWMIGPTHFNIFVLTHLPEHYSNTKALGLVLYTDYVFAFEVAAVILLVGIVAAITLVFRGPKDRKVQNVTKQLEANKANRLKIINMQSEK